MAIPFFFLFTLIFSITPTSHSIPFVIFHGLLNICASEDYTHLTNFLSETSGEQGQCIEIGNWASDSLTIPLMDQIQIACDKVKKLEHLKDGYNIVAISQGTLIGRGVVEFCDDAPPVKNFISVAGPLAGVAAIPYCSLIFGSCCDRVEFMVDNVIYGDILQNMTTVATFCKSPENIDKYLEKAKFLPVLNNERPESRNDTYKERFSSLQNLVLIMFEGDLVLIPKETSWFGFYKDGTRDVLPVKETKLYIEDWIGLKSLDEQGKVKYFKAPGAHAALTDDVAKQYVIPYLKDSQAATYVM